MGNVTKKKIGPGKFIHCKRCSRKKKVSYGSLCASVSLCGRCANIDVEWTLE